MVNVGISVELALTGMKPEKKPCVPFPDADSEIGRHGSANDAWTTEWFMGQK